MVELFIRPYHANDIYKLSILKRISEKDLDVKCTCGDTINIRDYSGKCCGCGREFCGPLMRK